MFTSSQPHYGQPPDICIISIPYISFFANSSHIVFIPTCSGNYSTQVFSLVFIGNNLPLFCPNKSTDFATKKLNSIPTDSSP